MSSAQEALEAAAPLEALRILHLQELKARHLDIRAGKVGDPPALPACPHKPPKRGRTHLIIGDSHAHPDHHNWRYDWLGRMIVDRRPDVIVDIGDWWDMPSLFSFDRGGSGKKSLEDRRYVHDLMAGIDAMQRVKYHIDEHNRGKRGSARYKPRKIRTLGNHEERIARAVEWKPVLEGIVGFHDLQSEGFGWEEHPPGEVIEVDGVHYCHYFADTRSYGQKYLAANAILGESSAMRSRSSGSGHAHRRDFFETDGPCGPIAAVNAGCFFDYEMEWLPKARQRRWWRGLTLLHDVRGGHFDPEFIGIGEVQRRYGV